MRLLRFAPVMLLVCASGGAVSAQKTDAAVPELQPQDFAYGITLSVPPGEPFIRFDLPMQVLTGVAWPDLRDIRVFNAAGQTVPFARIQPPTARDKQRRVALQSFLLESTKPGSAPVIQLDARARGVELRVTPGATAETGAEYLLAIGDSTLNTPIDRLHLEWDQVATNWQQTVTVSVSRDLDNWQTVARARPLLDLTTTDGQRLRHAEVNVNTVSPETAKYWRLRFGPGFAPTLTNVEAETTTFSPPAPGVIISTYSRVESDGSGIYELMAPQPVSRIRITPQDANSVLQISIEGRASAEERWQPITRTVAFRLIRDGQQSFSDPVELNGRMLKSLRLRPLQSAWGTSIPQVDVERDPVTIVLNARGAGPFLLAWGARAASDGTVPIRALVPNQPSHVLIDLPAATEGARVTLGGPSRYTALAPAERAARWQTTLMWVVLVGGAAALALLAFKVYRETQSVPKNPT